MGSFAETYGTYVNCEGRWQSFAGAATPLGEARPGWKVLRVLGNALGLPAFEYQSAEEVRDEVHRACIEPLATAYAGRLEPAASQDSSAVVDVPMYHVDALVRRAPSLQRTRQGRAAPAIYE
jgi:NADH-quinone oxidoreductase subunit G